MSSEFRREEVEKIKALYPVGTEVMLIKMSEDPNPIPPNTKGVVEHVDDMGQIHCRWENGRNMALVPQEDDFIKFISPTKVKEEWSKEKQYEILEKFFFECVRYWERTLVVDSDLDRSAYEKALLEIPDYDPNIPYENQAHLFDKDVRDRFIVLRYLDTYGRNWETHYNEREAKFDRNHIEAWEHKMLNKMADFYTEYMTKRENIQNFGEAVFLAEEAIKTFGVPAKFHGSGNHVHWDSVLGTIPNPRNILNPGENYSAYFSISKSNFKGDLGRIFEDLTMAMYRIAGGEKYPNTYACMDAVRECIKFNDLLLKMGVNVDDTKEINEEHDENPGDGDI